MHNPKLLALNETLQFVIYFIHFLFGTERKKVKFTHARKLILYPTLLTELRNTFRRTGRLK